MLAEPSVAPDALVKVVQGLVDKALAELSASRAREGAKLAVAEACRNVASAGGCLASQYLAAWVITRLVGEDAACGAMHYVAPVGEKEEYVARAMRNITPYLPQAAKA